MSKKIILVAPALNSFIQNDIDILSKKYEVITNIYPWYSKPLLPILIFRQFIYLFFKIPFTDKILVEFGGYWSMLPTLIGKLFGKPVFVILHGTDCASLPELSYGSLRKPLVRLFCKITYRHAIALLPVSSSLIKCENIFFPTDRPIPQGYKHFFPEIITNCKVIGNGIDGLFWNSLKENIKDDNSFIAVFSEKQFELKGGDLIIELAKSFENCKFYMAGMKSLPGSIIIPHNVVNLGYLNRKELREYFRRCQFHLQLSSFEGFGISLCEAMLCNCIPIGSSVNSIPEIIGDTGFILETKNLDQCVELIKKVLLSKRKKELGELARNRILNRYSLEKRTTELLQTINNYS